MLHDDINNPHIDMIMLHVYIFYLACRRDKYATITKDTFNDRYNTFMVTCFCAKHAR